MLTKNTIFIRWILICSLLFLVNPVFAKGGLSLGASSSYNYDSNVFRSATNVKQSQYFLVNPSATARLSISKLSLSAKYTGGFSYYQDTPENDSKDLASSGSLIWRANDRHGFDIKGGYSNAHIPRDSIETAVAPDDPVEFVERISMSVKTVFPLPKEKYDIQLGASASDSQYSGSDADEKNKKSGLATAELQYLYSGKTFLVYGYKANLNNLKLDLYSNLDSVSQTLYVGARWLTTGKTSSHAFVGYNILQLSGPDTSSYGGLNIDISAIWQRKSYSKVTLTVIRTSSDSLLYGTGFLVNNQLSLSLSHSLTNRWSVGFGPSISAFQSYAEYRHLGGSMTFNTRYTTRWVAVGVRSGYQFRNSLTNDNSDFSGYTAAIDLAITI